MSRRTRVLLLLAATELAASCTMSAAPPDPAAGALTASQTAEVLLGNTPVTVTLPAPDEQRLAAILARGEPLYLAIEGPKAVQSGAIYQIYLDLPAGRAPDPAGPCFVGNLALYTPPGGPADSRLTYDLSAPVKALRRRGEWKGPVRVTFVPEYPGEVRAGALRFTRVSIVER
jgi:hypothetical protein